jgi:eukaryotic-like serine/threonine-protein kinase
VQAGTERDRARSAEKEAQGQARIASGERDKARAERDEREKAQRLEQAARAAAQEQVVRLHLRTGESASARGDKLDALHWFAAAWAADATDPVRQELQRLRFGAAMRNLPRLQSVQFHDNPIEKVWFSPDGRCVLTQTGDSRAYLSSAETGRLIVPPLVHPRPIVRCGFNQDGSRVFTLSADDAVRIWDAATGQFVGRPIRPAEGKSLAAADLSPDGKTVLLAGRGAGTIELVAVETGAIETQWTVTSDPISLRFDPTGRCFAAAVKDKAVIWELGKAEAIASVPHRAEDLFIAGKHIPNPSANSLPAFTPNGKLLATLTPKSRGIEVWDTTTGKSVTGPLSCPGAHGIWISPKGTYVLTAPNGADGSEIKIFETATGKLVLQPQHVRNPTNGTFSPDEQHAVIRFAGNEVQIYAVATGKIAGKIGPCGRFIVPQFSPDGHLLLTAEQHGIVRVWRVRNLETGDPYDLAGGGPPDGYMATPNGTRRLAVVEGGVAVLDRNGKPVGPPLKNARIDGSAWLNPDGSRAAIADKTNGFRIWNTATGEPMTEWFGPAGRRLRATFDPSGRLLVTAGPGGNVSRWHADTGREAGPPFQYGDSQSTVFAVACSPDGKRWGAAGNQNCATIFNAADPSRSITLWHTGWVPALAFSPDSRFIATGGDLTARVWDAASGKPVGPVLRHDRGFDSVSSSPDGKLLLTTSTNAASRVWDWRTGYVVAFTPHVSSSAGSPWFSRDGHRIAYFPGPGAVAPPMPNRR